MFGILYQLPEKIPRHLIESYVIAHGLIRGEKVAMAASFIKALSKCDFRNNHSGSSDPSAMVSREGRTYGLGYKVHISADVDSDLPQAFIAAPENEKHTPGLHARADASG